MCTLPKGRGLKHTTIQGAAEVVLAIMDKQSSLRHPPSFLAHLVQCLLLLCPFFASSLASGLAVAPRQDAVRRACSFTRYPNKCTETLGGSGLALDELRHGDEDTAMVYSLVRKTREETLLSTHRLLTLDDRVRVSQSPKTLEAIGYCDELMEMSIKRLDQSMAALKSTPMGQKEDIQTWLSAVLTFQDACKDSVGGFPGPLASQTSTRMDNLTMLASNALALANRIPDVDVNGRRLTSSTVDAFPDWVSPEDRRLLEGADVLKPHAVVAQDGSGDFLTISEALEAVGSSLAGGGRKVIQIKAGVYKQKLKVGVDNVMLVGAGKGTTRITNGASVGGGTSMPNTATVVVTGDRFIAKDITFENTASADDHQALALRISSDHAVLYNCRLRSHQDTLYAFALRQFYKNCDIYGSIDYIFGNAAAVFQSCSLLFQKPHHNGINTVTASGRTDPGQNTGFSIQGCRIAAGPELEPVKHSVKSYLGRPWKKYARVVVMQCNIDDSIQKSGWAPWSGSLALKTLYFGEYNNGGAGASLSGRVSWPGFHVMDKSDASKFTVANFISGTSWLPSTGVSFSPGL